MTAVLEPTELAVDPLAELGRALLVELGEDPDREGLLGTPARWAAWLREFVSYEPGNMDVTFEAVTVDQMVVVSGVQVHSLCEHHLLPFSCRLTMAYIPDERVLGLSKLARVAHHHAHRLQLQERLCAGIADDVARLAASENVAVIGRGEHLCMTMRGVRSAGMMSTSVMRGRFRRDSKARQELLSLEAQ